MANQPLGAVYRGDGRNGSRRDLRSREADGLAVEVVEDDVFRREVDVQADDTAPPQLSLIHI